MKGGEIKIKYAMVEEGQKMECEITTDLFFRWEHHIFDLWARPSPYLKILVTGVTQELVTADVAFLMHWENCGKKFSVALGFLSGVITFHSDLIVTMTWLHCSVPLGLNVNVSSLPLMLSMMILAATSIVAPAVLKNGLPRISGV
jgi:hypothetical protein